MFLSMSNSYWEQERSWLKHNDTLQFKLLVPGLSWNQAFKITFNTQFIQTQCSLYFVAYQIIKSWHKGHKILLKSCKDFFLSMTLRQKFQPGISQEGQNYIPYDVCSLHMMWNGVRGEHVRTRCEEKIVAWANTEHYQHFLYRYWNDLQKKTPH